MRESPDGRRTLRPARRRGGDGPLAAASVDDIGAAAGRASAKAAGVVVDDTAVTPQFLEGSAAARELPIIKKIAIGSLRNKLLFILPAALMLSQFRPGCSRPADLRRHLPGLRGRREDLAERSAATTTPGGGHRRAGAEGRAVARARAGDGRRSDPHRLHPVRRDHGDRAQGGRRTPRPTRASWTRAAILIVVALFITLAVYGFVALHREDGRHRRPPGPRIIAVARRSATRWSRACPRCSRSSPWSAPRPCSGWVATSC